MVNRSDDIRHILSQVSNVILEAENNIHSFISELEVGEAYFDNIKFTYSIGSGSDLNSIAGPQATQATEFATVENLTAHLPNEEIDVMNDERISSDERFRLEHEADADMNYKVDSDEPDYDRDRDIDWDNRDFEPRHNFESITEMVHLLDMSGVLTEDKLDPERIAQSIITQLSNEDGTMAYEKDLAKRYIAKVVTQLTKIPQALKNKINKYAHDILYDAYAKESGYKDESVEFFKEMDSMGRKRTEDEPLICKSDGCTNHRLPDSWHCERCQHYIDKNLGKSDI